MSLNYQPTPFLQGALSISIYSYFRSDIFKICFLITYALLYINKDRSIYIEYIVILLMLLLLLVSYFSVCKPINLIIIMLL